MADRLLLKKLPEAAITQRKTPDDDTRELCALMDNIPNAKSVAAMYRQLMRTGRLKERFAGGDPARRWLEVEQIVLDRNERKKGNKRKIIWMVVVFITVGIASYLGGVYFLAKGKHLAMQVLK